MLLAGCGETTTGERMISAPRTHEFRGDMGDANTSQPGKCHYFGALLRHPADGNRIVAFSLFGEIGKSLRMPARPWRKIAREFGEIRAAAWVPN